MNIKKSLIYSFSESYLIVIIQLASSMVLARLLTPQEIGQFSIGIAILAIAHMLRDFGIGSYLIQEKELTKQKIKTAFGLTLLISWTLAAILYFSRHAIAIFYNETNIAIIMAWMSINFIIIPFSSPVFALLRRDMKFNLILYINLISSLIAAGTGIYLAYQGYGYMSLVWSSITRILTTALLASCFRPSQSFVLPSLKGYKDIISFGGKTSLSNIILTLGNNVSELIIGKYLGFASVAIFSKSNTVNNLFSDNFLAAIKKVYLPFIAQSHRDNVALDKLYLQATSYISSIAVPFYCFIIFYSEEIILILFGSQWLESASLIQILSLGGILQSFSSLAPNTLYAIKRPGVVLTCETFIQSIKISLISMASFFSLDMIAWAFVLSNVISLTIYILVMKKEIKISMFDTLIAVIIPNLFLGLLISLSLFYFNINFNNDFPLIGQLSVGFCISIFTWSTSLLSMNFPIKKELDNIL